MKGRDISLHVLLVLIMAVCVYSYFSVRDQTKEAISRIDSAQINIRSSIVQMQYAKGVVHDLQGQLEIAQDSITLIKAERDSIIYNYERWSSDTSYRKYSKKLQEQSAKLYVLRSKYQQLLTRE